MGKKATGRLWSEIPEDERLTREELLKCNGAKDAWWVDKQMSVVEHPQCKMAVHFNHGFFKPCSWSVMPGEDFCPTHGGMNGYDYRMKCELEETERLRVAHLAHLEWRAEGLVMAEECRRREIDRLHDIALGTHAGPRCADTSDRYQWEVDEWREKFNDVQAKLDANQKDYLAATARRG